ncbi:hypothetical protein A9239_12055 [Methanosarcina sp. A14]|uniref:Type I restriction-modification system, specificity subunit S n=2 Tax=Methanosarcina barkeri TaxID=2208 RepID=A0A0E3QVQ6_METBA|nr:MULTISPECIES: restriction endonuclease subunit S [Methanosarcina]AKB54844.1 Type I restriction-modification system, specificity subunit S [Methanosarcina barkeri MS]AKJ37645.1 type I restriction-modification system S subunit HsdS1 [Methanosarcina barkeri CM1]OED06087.1 hypothetical protein A9239_12055 [Methanosarcina sp. A14]
MNPDVFFENFELLADAPNGVQKLRELILQLAVMGKLVPHDPNDEPASILVERIKTEKKKLNKKEKNNGSKQLHPVTKDDIHFEVPNNWETVRLGQVYDIEYGKSLSEKYRNSEGEFPVYGSNGIVGFHTEYLVDKPSLIIGRKGSAGAVNLSDKPFWPIDTTYFVTPKKGLDLFFSYYLFKTLDLGKFNKATAIPGLNRQDAYGLIIKIPPLAEQKRIVSKVEELMALCDKLEARRQKKQEIQSKLNSAALDRMLSAEKQDEFEQRWQHICENFDLLYDNPENVERLKQAILQLAVQGKLVTQNPEDEPASVLIEKINSDKKNLIKAGKIKGTKSLSPLEATDDVPTLPEKWEFVNLDSIILFMDAGWSPACRNHPTEDEDTWGVLKTTSVQPLMFLWTEHKQLPENLIPRPQYEVKVGDILITRAGPKNRVGICCLVKDTRSHLMISDKIIRFHLLDEFVFPEFITLCLNTGFSQNYIESQKSGMAESQMNISQNKLRMTPIPLPPLAEQKRIVEKVEQFMGLCDELESNLRKEQEDSEKLMEAVVKGLLEGEDTEKTELEKPIPLQVATIKLK